MKTLDYLFAVAVILSTLYVPYTKVEESFYMQAVHDILKWNGISNSDYDHLSFPGVVPRSFVGPLAVATLAYPAKLLNYSDVESIRIQIAVRIVVGWAVVWANSRLRKAIRAMLGSEVAAWYGIFCICQFHYTFWTSRLLGNTLSLVPMLIAQSYWIRCSSSSASKAARQRFYTRMSITLAFICVVLRFDVVAFAAAMLLSELSNLTVRGISQIMLWTITFVLLTICVDSYYWRERWMWPELSTFWFNAIEGRSSEWGVLPHHYYFTYFLPRLLMGALPFVCVGALASMWASRHLLMPYVAAIAVFSANPHKEWRFIVHAIPIFNMCAAIGVVRLGQFVPLRKRQIRLAASAIAVLSLLATLLMTHVSSLNYPGGQALAKLHEVERLVPKAHVHIDTFSAMTGVARFGEITSNMWIYNKTEGLLPGQYGNFTHLLTSQPDIHVKYGFSVIAVQTGYAGIKLPTLSSVLARKTSPPFITIKQEPLVWIMRNDNINLYLYG